jgi:hypothetical protein
MTRITDIKDQNVRDWLTGIQNVNTKLALQLLFD